jgi:hypothetical protein
VGAAASTLFQRMAAAVVLVSTSILNTLLGPLKKILKKTIK